MAGSHEGPALFELLDRPTPGGDRPARSAPAGRPVNARTGGHRPVESVTRPRPSVSDAVAARLLWLDGGRLNVSLTSGAAAGALFLAGVIGILTYLAGLQVGTRRGEEIGFVKGKDWYQAEVGDEIARARAGPPTPGLTRGLEASSRLRPPPPQNPRAASAGIGETKQRTQRAWVRGRNYVVVQQFKPDAIEDARAVREYLAQNGVETVIVSRPNLWHFIISTQGFDLQDTTQKQLAARFMEKIRRIGAGYKAAGGRYDFHDCYPMKLKGDSW